MSAAQNATASKHTPGPWKVGGVVVTARVGFSECVVCDINVSAPCGGGTYDRSLHLEEYRANARLIAAAPNLLMVIELIASEARDDAMPWARSVCRAAINSVSEAS